MTLEPLLRRTSLPAPAFSSSKTLGEESPGSTRQGCEKITSGHFYRKCHRLTQEIGSLGNGKSDEARDKTVSPRARELLGAAAALSPGPGGTGCMHSWESSGGESHAGVAIRIFCGGVRTGRERRCKRLNPLFL